MNHLHSTSTFLSKRKYTDATNTPWKEYRKWVVNDQMANEGHDPRRGFGHRWCRIFVTPSKGRRKKSDFKDFLRGKEKTTLGSNIECRLKHQGISNLIINGINTYLICFVSIDSLCVIMLVKRTYITFPITNTLSCSLQFLADR